MTDSLIALLENAAMVNAEPNMPCVPVDVAIDIIRQHQAEQPQKDAGARTPASHELVPCRELEALMRIVNAARAYVGKVNEQNLATMKQAVEAYRPDEYTEIPVNPDGLAAAIMVLQERIDTIPAAHVGVSARGLVWLGMEETLRALEPYLRAPERESVALSSQEVASLFTVWAKLVAISTVESAGAAKHAVEHASMRQDGIAARTLITPLIKRLEAFNSIEVREGNDA